MLQQAYGWTLVQVCTFCWAPPACLDTSPPTRTNLNQSPTQCVRPVLFSNFSSIIHKFCVCTHVFDMVYRAHGWASVQVCTLGCLLHKAATQACLEHTRPSLQTLTRVQPSALETTFYRVWQGWQHSGQTAGFGGIGLDFGSSLYALPGWHMS